MKYLNTFLPSYESNGNLITIKFFLSTLLDVFLYRYKNANTRIFSVHEVLDHRASWEKVGTIPVGGYVSDNCDKVLLDNSDNIANSGVIEELVTKLIDCKNGRWNSMPVFCACEKSS